MNTTNILLDFSQIDQPKGEEAFQWTHWPKHLITVCCCLIDWPEDVVYPGVPVPASYHATEKQESAVTLLGALLGQVGK